MHPDFGKTVLLSIKFSFLISFCIFAIELFKLPESLSDGVFYKSDVSLELIDLRQFAYKSLFRP